jgi:hypothetical protein
MSSIRQQVMDALETRLKTVLISNGYSTNAGQKVYPWRLEPFTPADMPGIALRDPGEDVEAEAIKTPKGRQLHKMRVELYLCATGSDAVSTARAMILDVMAAIGTDPTFGGLIDWVSDIKDEVQADQEDNLVCSALVSMTFNYRREAYSY